MRFVNDGCWSECDKKEKKQIINIDPIFVLGNVTNPGKPLYNETLSIASAIQSSGGYKGSADTTNFEILRTKDPEKIGLFPVTHDNETLKSGDASKTNNWAWVMVSFNPQLFTYKK